jgi:Holliday junction resolvase-like predicted endonuclease
MGLRADHGSAREERHLVASPEKQKGTRAEVAVVKWLQALGYKKAHRTRAGFHDDIGDIELRPDLVIEVKDRAKLDLPGWLKHLGWQKANKDAELGVVIIKKRGSSDVYEWAFVLDAATFVNLLRKTEGQ